jgi:Domain of unknown function (DUF4232)
MRGGPLRWVRRMAAAVGTSALVVALGMFAGTPAQAAGAAAAATGGVTVFGNAVSFGAATTSQLHAPIVRMATTRDGKGYWLASADGGVYTFGDGKFFGSMGGKALNEPIVGIAATPDGGGYWMMAADGGIFTFGDAHFFGSTGGSALAEPIVGMAATPHNGGYWFVSTIIAPTTTCESNQLSVAYDPADSPGGAAGSVGRTYRLINTSSRLCTMIGYPGLRMLDSSGRPLTTNVSHSTANGPASTVSLLPGASAFFTIVYPTQTGFGNLVCPTSSSLAVIPPNNTTALVLSGAGGQLQPYGGDQVHPQCGNIGVTLVASRPPFR